MSEQFDGYYKWLGIPPKDQPPNHYRLLSIELYEDNPEVIEASAERQATYLHEVSAGPHVKESQKLLNEIAAARLCLLDAEKKAAYDEELRSKVTANVTVDALSGGHSPLDDLPWDNLEPLMTNGSSSDTAPQGQAASETLRIPAADSSGVFSKPKSLMATSPGTPAKAKASRPAMFWIVIGGGVAIAIALVVFLLVNSGDDDGPGISQQPGNETPKVATPPAPDMEELNKKDAQTEKKNGKRTPPTQRGNGNDTKNDKEDDTKKDSDKNPPKKENDPKQAVKVAVAPKGTNHQTGNNTKNGTTDPKNGNGGKPEPIRTNGFQPLTPVDVTSTTGRTSLEVVSKDCVLAKGSGEVDGYIVQMETDIPDISAIRLEALTHMSLPGNGPGLDKNGDFSICELVVFAVPANKPTEKREVPISGVASEEAPSALERLTDGKEHTFWKVERPGETTALTMFLHSPILNEPGTNLYLEIQQRELLGYFRVSVSNDSDLAGKKTRVQATLPLFANLGGQTKTTAGTTWHEAQEFDSGPFGYVGGKAEGNDNMAPFSSCISGIKEFRVNVPDGRYNVRLLFSGRCPTDMSKRSFSINARGLRKPFQVKGLQARVSGFPVPLPNLEAKDGVLVIEFKPDKGQPVLNGIEIYDTSK